jgi:3'5'-cyclic nucleotide phosphodiesterase
MLGQKYNFRSVAEKLSLDLTWDLLMENRFADLRAVIYSNVSEFRRFRELLVGALIATDILDPDLKKLRNMRWENAFSDSQKDDGEKTLNRKATIVMQHLLEASDVAHCMQHWHVYRKWNERLFREMTKSFREGRGSGKDPAEFWYEGELAFFDRWIIPLAQKLHSLPAFGVASDEYLTYAELNRSEWELKGEEEVQKMVDNFPIQDAPKILENIPF